MRTAGLSFFRTPTQSAQSGFLKASRGFTNPDALSLLRAHALLGSDMMLQMAVVLWVRCLFVENVCFANAKHTFSYIES